MGGDRVESGMDTVDRKPACHFEHTVAVTDVGVDVLTDGRRPFTL